MKHAAATTAGPNVAVAPTETAAVSATPTNNAPTAPRTRAPRSWRASTSRATCTTTSLDTPVHAARALIVTASPSRLASTRL